MLHKRRVFGERDRLLRRLGGELALFDRESRLRAALIAVVVVVVSAGGGGGRLVLNGATHRGFSTGAG